MSTPLSVRLALKWHARYFVDAMYQAILGRKADVNGSVAYETELRRHGDLKRIARAMATSEEAWGKAVFDNPAPVVTAAFRGLLGRDPEPDALHAYSETLPAHRDLTATLSDIASSDEHWQRLLAGRAEDIVRFVFLALLKREPDPEALTVYAQELRMSRDLPALISTVAASDEHWEQLLQGRRLAAQLLQSDNLPALLVEVIKSPKVWNELLSLKFPSPDAANVALASEAWVFIHAQKTGGTSLQNMLVDTFRDGLVFREHGNSLYLRSAAELAPYSIFAGHFDFDTVAYIPRARRHLLTLLRDPRERLLSHYRFLRAHKPGSPLFKGAKEIADRLDATDFFRSVITLGASDFWNHLTWCVMGRRKWNAYRSQLQGLEGDSLNRALSGIRQEIRGRLREFTFIGLQEDFPFSCQRLFELIGARLPHLRHDHSVAMLAANTGHFRDVERRPLTAPLRDALEPLVMLDEIVYQEGGDLYSQRYGRVAEAGTYRPI